MILHVSLGIQYFFHRFYRYELEVFQSIAKNTKLIENLNILAQSRYACHRPSGIYVLYLRISWLDLAEVYMGPPGNTPFQTKQELSKSDQLVKNYAWLCIQTYIRVELRTSSFCSPLIGRTVTHRSKSNTRLAHSKFQSGEQQWQRSVYTRKRIRRDSLRTNLEGESGKSNRRGRIDQPLSPGSGFHRRRIPIHRGRQDD